MAKHQAWIAQARRTPIQMQQAGWQPLVALPKHEVVHHHDPIWYLLVPLLCYLLTCVAIAALLIHGIGPISPW